MAKDLNFKDELSYAEEWVRATTKNLDDNSDDPAVMAVYATTALAQAQIATALAIADLASAVRESKSF